MTSKLFCTLQKTAPKCKCQNNGKSRCVCKSTVRCRPAPPPTSITKNKPMCSVGDFLLPCPQGPETPRTEPPRPEPPRPEPPRPEPPRLELQRPEPQRLEPQRPEPQRPEPQRPEPQGPEPQSQEHSRPELSKSDPYPLESIHIDPGWNTG